jgi:hypothetical protein
MHHRVLVASYKTPPQSVCRLFRLRTLWVAWGRHHGLLWFCTPTGMLPWE